MTFEDQARINAFGRLTSAASELRDEIARRKKMLEAIQDAGSELILADEDDSDAVTYGGESAARLRSREEKGRRRGESAEEGTGRGRSAKKKKKKKTGPRRPEKER